MNSFQALLHQFLQAYETNLAHVVADALEERDMKALADAVRANSAVDFVGKIDLARIAKPWPWGSHKPDQITKTMYWQEVREQLWHVARAAGVEVGDSSLLSEPNTDVWMGFQTHEQVKGDPRYRPGDAFPFATDGALHLNARNLDALRDIQPAKGRHTLVYVHSVEHFFQWISRQTDPNHPALILQDDGITILESRIPVLALEGVWFRRRERPLESL